MRWETKSRSRNAACIASWASLAPMISKEMSPGYRPVTEYSLRTLAASKSDQKEASCSEHSFIYDLALAEDVMDIERVTIIQIGLDLLRPPDDDIQTETSPKEQPVYHPTHLPV